MRNLSLALFAALVLGAANANPIDDALAGVVEAQVLMAELLGMLTAAGIGIWVGLVIARQFRVK